MTDNWQLLGGKSNKAMDIISSLKGVAAVTTVSDTFDAKKADSEYKRQIESESEAAKALAAELVFSAGMDDSRLCSFTVDVKVAWKLLKL